MHFTLKTNPLANRDLEVKVVYQTEAFAKWKETDRFKRLCYDEIAAEDKANLDILWLKDESLATAPAEFRAVEEALLTEN